MSDRIVIMNHGRIVQIGTPSDLYEKPRTAFAASFLGKSNFIRRDGRTFALRPEKIDVAPAGQGRGQHRVQGTVRSTTYMGAAQKVIVAVPGLGDIEVHAPTWRMPHQFTPSQAVDICWSDEAAVEVEDSEQTEAGGRSVATNPE